MFKSAYEIALKLNDTLDRDPQIIHNLVFNNKSGESFIAFINNGLSKTGEVWIIDVVLEDANKIKRFDIVDRNFDKRIIISQEKNNWFRD